MVPALVFLLGFQARTAVATALLFSACVKILASGVYCWHRKVDIRTAGGSALWRTARHDHRGCPAEECAHSGIGSLDYFYGGTDCDCLRRFEPASWCDCKYAVEIARISASAFQLYPRHRNRLFLGRSGRAWNNHAIQSHCAITCFGRGNESAVRIDHFGHGRRDPRRKLRFSRPCAACPGWTGRSIHGVPCFSWLICERASQSAALLHDIIGRFFAWERDCGNLSQICCATRDFIYFNETMGLEA
jgi:hypothetical protein